MASHAEQGTTSARGDLSHKPRRVGALVARVVLVVVCIVSVLLFAVERWLFTTWAALSADEILYHLSVSLEGTETSTIWKFVLGYLPFALLAIAAMLAVLHYGSRGKGRVPLITSLGVLAVSLGLAGFALYDAGRKVNIAAYLPSSLTGEEDFIGKQYVDPNSVELVFPEQRRNLIYLFLESVEMTYADEGSGGAFERNAIPELTQIAQENEDFSGQDNHLNGGIVFPGTDWTMGGLFAQTSGTPLKIPMAGEQLATFDELFPRMTVLGDILKREGYHQEFVLGSDVKFGGRNSYFIPHGSYDIYDYVWAQQSGYIPSDYKVFWGFEDEKLFDLLKARLTELSQASEPFNVTALTVDTHFEDGYVCRLCRNEFGDNQYANVMACSSRQVADFVKWVQKQDFYANTTIVICGDHTTMDHDFCENVPADYQRRTYTAIINGAAEAADPARTRSYATFDLFPTTLAAMGVTIPGDRLGLGTNLYGERDTLVEEFGVETLRQKLSRQSEFLNGYSDIKIDEDFMASAAAKTNLMTGTLDTGQVRFYINDAYHFKLETIERATLRVTDKRDNTTTDYAMIVQQHDVNDPNRFDCFVDTPYTVDDLKYLDAEVLITVGPFEDYPLASLKGEG